MSYGAPEVLWDLSFLGEGLKFYQCDADARRCEFVDANGRGWSRRRRDLIYKPHFFDHQPFEIRYLEFLKPSE